MLQVTTEATGPCRRVLQIQIPAETVNAEYGRVVADFARVAQIPGFRPGRAPTPIVERHFAKEILEETRERLVPRAYREALNQQQLRPVAIVDVSDIRLEKDLPLAFKVTVDVAPEFTLPPYKGIPLKSRAVSVSDTDVEEALTELREHHARYVEVSGRPARRGDLVQVDYRGTCEGQPLATLAGERAELSAGQDFWMRLGDAELLPGFAAGLEGANAGEERQVVVNFPQDFPVKELAGRQAVYAATLKAVREQVLPELDADFLATVGAESVEALRGAIRQHLQQAAEAAEKARLKDEIIQWLLLQADFKELPQTVIEAEARHIIREVVEENIRRGVSKEEIEAHREDIFSRAVQSAGDRVRVNYLLQRIADAEGLAVADEEVDQEVARIAGRYSLDPQRLRAKLEERGALANLRRELRLEKTLDFLLEAAAVEREAEAAGGTQA